MRYLHFVLRFLNLFYFYFLMWLDNSVFKFQVECSSMADMAQEIVKQNGYSNGSASFGPKY